MEESLVHFYLYTGRAFAVGLEERIALQTLLENYNVVKPPLLSGLRALAG